MGAHLEKTGELSRAFQCYQNSLELDPPAEAFYQCLMTCHQRLGDREKAAQVYNNLKQRLSASPGMEPSARSKAIYRKLSNGP